MTHSISFEVRYPWGASYCDQLRSALDKLGLVTADHPLLDGDSVGFMVARTRDDLTAGEALVEHVSETLPDADDWFPAFLDLVDRLETVGVMVVEHDWKHWEWTGGSLGLLGINLRLVSEYAADGESRFLLEVSRSTEVSG